MRQKRMHPRLYRLLAVVLVPGQVLISVPAAAQEAAPKRQAPPSTARHDSQPAPKVVPNRRAPKVAAVPALPVFSERPTDGELRRARVFDEPLVPVGGLASLTENKALSKAILEYLAAGGGDQTGPLEAFLKANPNSRWRVSLRTDLGIVYRRTGYFSRALACWEEAWALGKDAAEPNAHAIADRALGELADLNSRLGRVDTLETLLAQARVRDVRGSAAEKIVAASDGLWLMKNRPEVSFRCGPYALASVLRVSAGTAYKANADIWNYPSTMKGTSLAEMERLGNGAGLKLQMARRAPGAEVLLPAMVHWKVGHFAAIVKREGERYLVQDPTFGNQIWVRQAALDEEASGYALAREGPLPAGWQRVTESEGAEVWGRGATSDNDPNEQSPNDPNTNNCNCGGPGGGSGGSPMATYGIHLMLVNLYLADTPVGYTPPLGPAVKFAVRYNQREVFQPQIFYYSNLGPKWTFDWISYIQDDPSNPSADAFLYVRGGGGENYTGFNGSTQSYAVQLKSRAILVRTSSSPVRYERRLPDGAVEIFAQADGSLAYPRKVFMTASIDPQGNTLGFTYDANLRLVSVTDAIGQVTTLSYDLPSDPLKITKVTDPFGRYATFDYNSSGRLSKITDVIGIQSQFDYGAGDFIQALTTPYGTSTFATTDSGRDRWIEATDPLGGKERVQYLNGGSVAASDPPATVPAGFANGNSLFQYRNTFYWNKRAMALYPNDLTKARLIHWLHTPEGGITAGVKENEKLPLENRVWYRYAGQASPWLEGTSTQPAMIARVLDDGSTLLYQYAYNAIGKPIQTIDPLGREIDYVYGNNNTPDADPVNGTGMDLLQVKRKDGSSYDVLQTFTYNSQHKPLTIADARGATTTYAYNAAGQTLTVTTPPAQSQSQGATTSYSYDTNGYLTQVSGPVPGANTIVTYDGYGRRRTSTDPAGLTLTYDYDALDRVTQVTYPDDTSEQTTYNRLDAEGRRDRLGRWTRIFYDALRRVVATRDPAGDTTQYQYGGSGCSSCGGGGDQLTALIDPNGNQTSWTYDVQGRPIQETRADGSSEGYTYETTSSRLHQKTDRKGVTTTFAHLLDNKLASKTYSDATPAVSYTYDPVTGLMLTAANSTDTVAWTYDNLDRVATEASMKNASTVGYSYDDAGSRVALTLNGSSHLTYGYDQQSRLTGITYNGQSFGFGYDTVSRRTSMTYPNGVVTSYGYDTESRLTAMGASLGSTPITSFGYVYDAAGNRTTKTTLDWTETYGYDPANRLVSADRSTGTPSRWRFAYDPAGNRTTDQADDAAMAGSFNNVNQLLSRQAGGALTFKGTTNEPATVTVSGKSVPTSPAPANAFSAQAPINSGTSNVAVTATDSSGNTRTNTYQVSASGAGATYTYDPNGNLTSKVEGSDTWVYTWNAENQLTKVEKNGTEVARFAYDPLGRRVERASGAISTSYTYDRVNILREAQGATVLKYVDGPGSDEELAVDDGNALSFFHADGLGSIVETTSGEGAVTLSRQYDVWGNVQVGTGQAGYTFTGREWDPAIDLYYYRARYYDSHVGRFISEDPLNTRRASQYAYVQDQPTTNIDPSGLKETCVHAFDTSYIDWLAFVHHPQFSSDAEAMSHPSYFNLIFYVGLCAKGAPTYTHLKVPGDAPKKIDKQFEWPLGEHTKMFGVSMSTMWVATHSRNAFNSLASAVELCFECCE